MARTHTHTHIYTHRPTHTILDVRSIFQPCEGRSWLSWCSLCDLGCVVVGWASRCPEVCLGFVGGLSVLNSLVIATPRETATHRHVAIATYRQTATYWQAATATSLQAATSRQPATATYRHAVTATHRQAAIATHR